MIKLYEEYVGEFKEELEYAMNSLLLASIESRNLYAVKFFVDKGYNINNFKVIYDSIYYDVSIFRYLMESGLDLGRFLGNGMLASMFKGYEVQRILIDHGYGEYINDKVGFSDVLKNDPKYSDIIDRYTNIGKYNI